MARRNQYPSKKQVKEILMQAVVDPREKGPLQVAVELGDSNYFMLRAVEIIRNAQQALNTAMEITNQLGRQFNTQLEAFHCDINQAIGLLALARIKQVGEIENGPVQTEKE